MPTFPYEGVANGPVITPWSAESLGIALGWAGQAGAGTATVIQQNLAYYVPFWIVGKPWTARRVFYNSGATGTGNVDIGIYDSQGNRLVSTGSTAKAAAAAVTFIELTDTALQPGLYWMALASNSATDTFMRSGVEQVRLRTLYVRQQASAFALPNPATFAAATSALLPHFGLSSRTF